MNTTAVTDAILALGLLAGIEWLRRTTRASPLRTLWLATLAFTALGAVGGTAFHWGGPGDDAGLLWRTVSMVLGAAVSLLALCALASWRGYEAARGLFPFALAIVAGLRLTPVSVLDEVQLIVDMAAGVFVLVVFGALALRRQQGMALVFAGCLVSMAAGLLQAQPALSVQVVWRFDHNGLFHLVQMAGFAVMLPGVRRTLEAGTAGARV
ncbi:MAG: DUF6962 family protein [Gemmatimonadales bacterium]